jgi:hypothetical protein
MNFSISGFFSLNVCSQLFLGGKTIFSVTGISAFLVMVLPQAEVPVILKQTLLPVQVFLQLGFPQ